MAMQTMRGIHVHQYGGPEQLKFELQPRPEPQAGEVLLRIHAAGVNPIDWKIRQGLMKDFQPVTFPYTPGIEVTGVVEEVGPGVTAFEIGQAVFGQIASGAYAEYITVAVEVLALKPETLSSSLAVLKPGGTLISIADLPPQEQARVRGVRAMMSRCAASTPLQTFTRLIDEGHLKVTAGKTFPLSEVQQAHEYNRSGHGRGRIVLQVVDEAQNTFV